MTEKPIPPLYLEPAQSRVAHKKLVALVAAGYESCGVMIRRKTGDTVEYGAISSGGLVIWWQPVPTQQAPVAQQPADATEATDLSTATGQADAHLRALLRYTEGFYGAAISHGMRAGQTANAISHVERAGKALHMIVHAQAAMLDDQQPQARGDSPFSCWPGRMCSRSGQCASGAKADASEGTGVEQ